MPGCDTKDEIIYELYRTINILGGKSDILSIIGSYNDSLEDDLLLQFLKEWNDYKAKDDIQG